MSREQLEKSLQDFQSSKAKSAPETSSVDFAQKHHLMACDVIMHAIDKKIDLKQKIEHRLFAANAAQDVDALARVLRKHARHLNRTATAQDLLKMDGDNWIDA